MVLTVFFSDFRCYMLSRNNKVTSNISYSGDTSLLVIQASSSVVPPFISIGVISLPGVCRLLSRSRSR